MRTFHPQQFVAMEGLTDRLKQRARELGLSDAEVARRAGLSETRYGHYVRGRNRIDLETLVRITWVLNTTPHAMMGLDAEGNPMPGLPIAETSPRAGLTNRLTAIASALNDDDLETLVRLGETFAETRHGK